jgi:GDP-L-fucose synthase
MGFWDDKQVIVTGGAGFLGSAIVKKLREREARLVVVPRSADYDLRRADAIARLFDNAATYSSPEQTLIIHAAARVGGIGANLGQPATYFYDNLLMGIQLLDAAARRNVGKFVAIGSVCAYPKLAAIPFSESNLWNGYPEESNAAYGLAKKMLLVQAQAYRSQFGFNSIFLLPTNLYGPGDNFDPEQSHVIPALVRKCVEARDRHELSIVAWGTGTATRDYLFVEDAAEGILLAAERYDDAEPVNLSGETGEVSMRDLLGLICRLVDYHGEVVWDTSRPDGQPRRCVDGQRARELFNFAPTVSFENGLRQTIDWFEQQRRR